MLKLLAEYAKKHGIDTEPGFAPKEVRWVIACDQHGRFRGVVELGDVESKRNRGQEFGMCPDLTFSELTSGTEPKSHFLVETADIVTLLGVEPSQKRKVMKHQYFVGLLRKAGSAMPELSAAADCLADAKSLEEIRKQLTALKARPTEKVTLKIGDIMAVESDAWHDWWRGFRNTLTQEEPGERMRDFMTGELAKVARTHPKIKGLADVGGRAAGDVLIGFDKDSFRSYHLVQSANAAVSDESASVYRAALNELIKHHAHRLAGAKIVHWFKERVSEADDPLPWLVEGTAREELDAAHAAKELLAAIRTGKHPDLAGNYYYALTLSGQSGRVMVRDWMEGQFEELVANVAAWFDDLAVVHRQGGTLAPNPKLFAVLGATVRDLNEIPPPFAAKMWRVAVRNEPIPQAALAQVLKRTRVDIIEDQPPNHAGMGLMKAYHIRNARKEGGEVMSELQPYLNENHPSAAYQCGRLMAVLAQLQRSALGDVGAGVVQRYYAAASTTPALVLGRLTRTSQHHLNKLEGGLPHWYEEQIGSIWQRLRDIVPETLSLSEQSLFALGYYQQQAHMRTAKPKESEAEEGSDE